VGQAVIPTEGFVGFEVLTVVVMKIELFNRGNVACNLEDKVSALNFADKGVRCVTGN
jgi:hypothetical protein